MERHKSKVLMIRKGRNWEKKIGLEEWIRTEIGENVEVKVESTKDPQVFKVWCESKDA